jgi:hypothetical protein
VPPKDTTVRQAALKPETGAAGRARTAQSARPAASRATTVKPVSARPVAARPATPAARRAPAPAVTPKTGAARPAAATRQPPAAARASARITEQVTKLIVADAVRLLDWGNEWPQLASLIARLADRPSEKEIWSVLSEHRATIEARAKPRRD